MILVLATITELDDTRLGYNHRARKHRLYERQVFPEKPARLPVNAQDHEPLWTGWSAVRDRSYEPKESLLRPLPTKTRFKGPGGRSTNYVGNEQNPLEWPEFTFRSLTLEERFRVPAVDDVIEKHLGKYNPKATDGSWLNPLSVVKNTGSREEILHFEHVLSIEDYQKELRDLKDIDLSNRFDAYHTRQVGPLCGVFLHPLFHAELRALNITSYILRNVYVSPRTRLNQLTVVFEVSGLFKPKDFTIHLPDRPFLRGKQYVLQGGHNTREVRRVTIRDNSGVSSDLRHLCEEMCNIQLTYSSHLILQHGYYDLLYPPLGVFTMYTSNFMIVSNFTYYPSCPAAYFWAGRGRNPSHGFKIPVAKLGLNPLRTYRNEDVYVGLPNAYTWYDVNYVAVFCPAHGQTGSNKSEHLMLSEGVLHSTVKSLLYCGVLSVDLSQCHISCGPAFMQYDVLLKNCVSVTEDFDEVTKSIGVATSCVSQTIHLITTLKVMLKDSSTGQDQGVKAMKAKLLSEMSARFDKLQHYDLYVIAAFLDPRYEEKFLGPHVDLR
ncbi:DM13 domain [Trinorchestia longiramus]|nr:DM13 domain [Trinorchestia longiramus]